MKKIIPLMVMSVMLSTSALADTNTGDSASSEAAAQARYEKFKKENNIRVSSIKQFYMEKGLAEGRAKMFAVRRQDMNAVKDLGNVIYDARHLYLDGGRMQPPIILMGRQLYSLEGNGQRVEESKVRYQKVAPERYVNNPIDWQTFLISDEDILYKGPADDSFLAPRTPEESDVAEKFYQIGYAEGTSQVDQELKLRIKALTTIVSGMYNFHNLYNRGMVSMPKFTKSYIASNGNDTQLTLGTEVKEIVAPARFEQDPNNYLAVVGAGAPEKLGK